MMAFARTALSFWCLVLLNMGCGSSSDGAPDGAAQSAGAAAGGDLNAAAGAGGGGMSGGSSAGSAGSGGVLTSGGSTGSGGVLTTGGSAGSGGVLTSGGSAGSGGAVSNGGNAGSGQAGSSSAGSAGAGPASRRQKAIPIGGTNTAPNGYFEYLPPGYDGSSAAPLLVFWHGVGEDGNGGAGDLQKVLAHGPPGLIAKDNWDNQRPFIVLSPQFSAVTGNITPGGSCPSSAVIDTFLNWALKQYNVDKRRVYLSGLSCGAIGSWDYLAQLRGSVVAAAVLLSGNPGDPAQVGSAWQRAGCALGGVAIWSLHGDQDATVPYAPDHDTMTNLLACPAPPRRAAMFTDVVGAGHDIWDPIYDLSGGSGDIYAWLLSNAKP